MNTEQFKHIISEVVQRELKNVLPKILDEYFCSLPSKKEKEPLDEEIITSMMDEPEVVVPTSRKKEFKQYTKNEMLNAILNETKALPHEGALAMAGDLSETMTSPADKMIKTVENNDTATMLKHTFTKDYSKLLKAVDKKKRGGSSGLYSVGNE